MCKQEKNKYASGQWRKKLSPSKHFNSDPRVCVITQREALLNFREKYIALCGNCICFCGNNKPYFSTNCSIPISGNKPAQFTGYKLPITSPVYRIIFIGWEIRHDLMGRRRIDNYKKKIALRLDYIFSSCVWPLRPTCNIYSKIFFLLWLVYNYEIEQSVFEIRSLTFSDRTVYLKNIYNKWSHFWHALFSRR